MTGRIGISIGDVTGIGPEVTLKALAQEAPEDDARYLILGDFGILDDLNRRLGLKLPLKELDKAAPEDRFQVSRGAVSKRLPLNFQPGDHFAAWTAMIWLRDGAELCLHTELDALVTAPVNKESIISSGAGFCAPLARNSERTEAIRKELDAFTADSTRAKSGITEKMSSLGLGKPFVGQTEFLSQMAGTDQTAMMLLGHDDRGRWLRVVLATTHVPLRSVAENLTQPKIELAIELAAKACVDLKLPQARIAVCGLNPHAGEGGKIGTEEITVIQPAVAAMQKRGLNVHGPFAADALFHSVFKGDYEIVVAMYHDQGLAPLKMIAFDSGINWTLGLPFIRTSPDHGTAYDIAGKGVANPSSMRAAIRLAKQLAKKSA